MNSGQSRTRQTGGSVATDAPPAENQIGVKPASNAPRMSSSKLSPTNHVFSAGIPRRNTASSKITGAGFRQPTSPLERMKRNRPPNSGLDSRRGRQRDGRSPNGILDIVECATAQLGSIRHQPTRKKELVVRDVVFPELVGEQSGKARDARSMIRYRRRNTSLEIEPLFLKNRVSDIEEDRRGLEHIDPKDGAADAYGTGRLHPRPIAALDDPIWFA